MMFVSTSEKTNHQARPSTRPERSATDRDDPLPLERTKYEAKYPSQHDDQEKAGESTGCRISNGDAKPVQRIRQSAPRCPVRHKVERCQDQAR